MTVFVRDESFITRWGPVIFRARVGGGSETFLVMYCGGGIEIKSPWGREVRRGGVIYIIRYLVGSDVFH